MDTTRLAIKINSVATNDPCALCGERTDPQIGPELFEADTWALVCHRCGLAYAPQLVALLDLADAAETAAAMLGGQVVQAF